MALAKQFLKSKPVCKVTFSVSPETVNGAKSVALVGDFNEWNAEAAPLKKQKDGSYKATVELPVGGEYQFRYLVDGEQWFNDDTADKFVSSGVSADDNSVIVL